MEFGDYIRIVTRRWRSILSMFVMGICLAALVTMLIKPKYVATTSLFVSVDGSRSVSDLYQGGTLAVDQVKSFASLAQSAAVLEPVIQELGVKETPEDLAKDVSAVVPVDTVVINIHVTRSDPRQAADIANAIDRYLQRTIERVSPKSETGQPVNDRQSLKAIVVNEAAVPLQKVSPVLRTNLVIGAFAGLLAGLALAVLTEMMDKRVRGTADVARLTNSEVLGVVAKERSGKSRKDVQPRGQTMESLRRIRVHLQGQELVDGRRTLLVTSSILGEGKTTVAVGIAHAMAEAGAAVLLIDADARAPRSVSKRLGFEPTPGLLDALQGESDLDAVIQTGRGDFDIMPRGTLTTNPTPLFESPAWRQALASLQELYDFVVVDAPPVLSSTDSQVIGGEVGGAVIVVGAGRVKEAQLSSAETMMRQAHVRILGIVINE